MDDNDHTGCPDHHESQGIGSLILTAILQTVLATVEWKDQHKGKSTIPPLHPSMDMPTCMHGISSGASYHLCQELLEQSLVDFVRVDDAVDALTNPRVAEYSSRLKAQLTTLQKKHEAKVWNAVSWTAALGWLVCLLTWVFMVG